MSANRTERMRRKGIAIHGPVREGHHESLNLRCGREPSKDTQDLDDRSMGDETVEAHDRWLPHHRWGLLRLQQQVF